VRVLLLFEYASLNGGEHSLLSVAPRLQQQGIELTAVAPEYGPLSVELARLAIPIQPYVTLHRDGQRLTQEERREQLAAKINAVRPDLIHANSLSMARLAGPVAAGLGARSVGHLRDIVRLSKRAVADINRNSKLIAVSAATRDWHAGQGIDRERIVVAHNGVDLDRFKPRPASGTLRDRFDIPREAALLGAVGQIGMRKGLDVLLTALARTRRCQRRSPGASPDASTLNPPFHANDDAGSVVYDSNQHDVHLLIAGLRHSSKQEAVEYEQQLHEAAGAEPLRGRIHFIGRCDDMPAFYNEIDLLVHAARQEPLGRVLLEAAASGVPVVATRVGGTEEIFPPGSDSAWLVEADDPDRLAGAIVEALSDADMAGRRSMNGRAIVEQSFSAELAAERLMRVYREFETECDGS